MYNCKEEMCDSLFRRWSPWEYTIRDTIHDRRNGVNQSKRGVRGFLSRVYPFTERVLVYQVCSPVRPYIQVETDREFGHEKGGLGVTNGPSRSRNTEILDTRVKNWVYSPCLFRSGPS